MVSESFLIHLPYTPLPSPPSTPYSLPLTPVAPPLPHCSTPHPTPPPPHLLWPPPLDPYSPPFASQSQSRPAVHPCCAYFMLVPQFYSLHQHQLSNFQFWPKTMDEWPTYQGVITKFQSTCQFLYLPVDFSYFSTKLNQLTSCFFSFSSLWKENMTYLNKYNK